MNYSFNVLSSASTTAKSVRRTSVSTAVTHYYSVVHRALQVMRDLEEEPMVTTVCVPQNISEMFSAWQLS